MFELEENKTDDDYLQEHDDKAKCLAMINIEEWIYIVNRRHRATILELTENGGSLALATYLFCNFYKKTHLLKTNEFEEFYSSFLDRLKSSPG